MRPAALVDFESANVVAKRLLDRVSGPPFSAVPQNSRAIPKVGAVQHLPGEETVVMIARADKANYAGKAGGRNRTVLG